MSQRNVVSQAAPAIPADILALFGNPPLLSTEDPKIYNDWLSMVAQVIKPKGIIEWMWVKDIVDLVWEIRRLRGFKAQLIELRRSSRIAGIERPPVSISIPLLATWHEEPKPESKGARRRRIMREKLELSTERGSTIAFLDTMQNYDKVDKLLASAEMRRNALLREIQFYREGLAHLMEEASNKIIDAEYRETAVATE